MIITFNEESDYGQDVLQLIAMVTQLSDDNERNKGEIIQVLKQIRNAVEQVRERVAKPYNNVDYFGMEVVE